MILGTRKHRKPYSRWHWMFAFWPRRLYDGRIAWLRPVQWRLWKVKGFHLLYYRLPQ